MASPETPRGKNYFLFLKELIRLEEKEEFEEIQREFTSLGPAERELRGRALLHLRLIDRHYSAAGHALATFAPDPPRNLPLFSLEIGDMVRLVPEPERSGDYPSGTVYEKSAHNLTVAFHEELPDWTGEPDLMTGKAPHFQLHRSVNRATYKRMAEALEAVFQTQNTRLALLRDISLGLKEAESQKLDPQSIRWKDPGLNESQKKAVCSALAAKDVALVHGPPGTGKTTVLIEIIRQSLERKQSVFVTAPSNTACDNVLERLAAKGIPVLRLGHPARITEALREHTLDFKLALHPMGRDIHARETELARLSKKNQRYRERRSPGKEAERELRREVSLLKQEIRGLRKEVFERVMKEAKVIVGTPAGIQDKSVREKTFDLVVFDEATQATEPLSWIPLAHAKKAVLAGDHFQLPPTVRSQEAEKRGLGLTLFERYYDILKDERFNTLLDRQYRMNEKIMGFSSGIFYKNRLIADDSVKKQTLAGLKGVRSAPETEAPLLFIDTAGKGFEEKLEPGSESRYNPEEAGLVVSELKKLLKAGVPAAEVAVISPYSAQVRLLSSLLSALGPEIDSVDGFQGREKELVIVSLVRSNLTGELGFLGDTRRMNVAMTRARRKLVVVGDSATLSSLPFYKRFIRYAEENGAYQSVWELEEA